MILYDYLMTIPFNQLLTAMQEQGCDEDIRDYERMYEKLQTLLPCNPEHALVITVVRCEDNFEPGVFFYDVSGLDRQDGTFYAIEFVDWETWLAYEVNLNSLDLYGIETILVAILDEMSYCGYDYESSKKACARHTARLEALAQDIVNNHDSNISWDDICLDDDAMPNAEEQEMFETIAARNKALCDDMKKLYLK